MSETPPIAHSYWSPVWLMLGGRIPGKDVVPDVSFLDTTDPGWLSALADAVESCEPGATRVIAVEGTAARAFLALLAHRRWEFGKGKTPSTPRILAEIERNGGSVVETFVIWPSLESPRVAYPRSELRMVRWAQRSGVLGGGGNRLWARYAARSALFTPVATRLTPGLAFVITR